MTEAIATEKESIGKFSERAYFDYAMYVILDRALPHIGDGLKPVQRRIIYAMSELGLKSHTKYKKSARTIGDVLGKYHPHGDSACYEAMVLMAQSFSYRYPLVDGQGNWGNADDPKSFAAMRYTEARLTPYANALLNELDHAIVDWGPNFDGTLKEPLMLPACVPNVLLNGASGIAVGMATDIPPHNANEVIDACIHLIDHPKATVKELMQFVPSPDYPTGAEIITPTKELQTLYTQGQGSVRLRATYLQEDEDIVITQLPYQTSGGKVLEQIASQMLAKKLPTVTDLRDESDHENPTRLVITLRSNRVNTEELMSHLFATTDLERTYRVNLNVIGLDGRPQVKPLNKLLSEWVTFRTQTVRRRLECRLEKVKERLHILDGLLIAFLNIDEVIHIIRTADKPKPALMKKFKLSDVQADAILETKLRQLAKLEEIKIKTEQNELAGERKTLEAILGSKARLKTLLKKELKAAAETFADPRRSQLVEREEARAIREEAMIPAEATTIILSKKGWVRAAKGHEIDGTTLNYRAGDAFLGQARGKGNQPVVFFDSNGKSYTVPAHKLPSARGFGDPLTSRLKPEPGVQFISVIMDDPQAQYLVASDAGYGFVTALENLHCKNRAGKSVLRCPTGSQPLALQRVENIESQRLAIVTTEGRLLVFPLAELPVLPKGKGNKMIQIPSKRVAEREEYCTACALLNEGSTLTLHSGRRHLTLKPKDLANFHGERGRRGNKLPRGFRTVSAMEAGE